MEYSRHSFFLLLALGAALPVAAQSKQWVDPSGERVPQKSIVDQINFETDTAVVVMGQVTLRCVAEAMKENQNLYVCIEGFADGRGGEEYNLRLSQARASAVAHYVEYLGGDPKRIQASGHGKIGHPEDPVTNFSRRKAVILLRQGGFEGEAVTQLPPTVIPCETSSALSPDGATIETTGHTFHINVNYEKIRNDFRAEVAQILAQRDMEQTLAEKGRAQATDPGPTKTLPEHSFASPHGSIDEILRSYRVTIGAYGVSLNPAGGVSSESNLVSLDASGMLAVSGGGVQVGVQAETGSFRRKVQGDLAYSAIAGPVQATVFAGYANLSGTATDTPALTGGRTAFLAGARIGMAFSENLGAGLTYANASSGQTGTGNAAQEPRGFVGGDFWLNHGRWSCAATVYDAQGAQRRVAGVVPALTQKIGCGGEVGFHFADTATFLIRAESLPIYTTFSSKNETRAGFAIRIGGMKSGQLPTWVTLPTVRQIFPF